jgi:vitamin B12 transporter
MMTTRCIARAVRRRFPAAVIWPSAIVLCAASAAAQNLPPPETVLITARPRDPVGNAAFSAVLLDGGQLQFTPRLDEALRQVPGLSLFRSASSASAYPARLGVSLRSLIGGSGVGRALVTLDGVPQNDPFGQWVVPASLPVEGIQSVEIVRGAGAGPYGAGALTGVIELSEKDAPGALADAEAGNLQQQRYVFAGNTQTGNVNIGATGTYQKSGGWFAVDSAQRGAADTPVSLESKSLSARAAAEIIPGTLLSVRFGVYDERRALGIVGAVADSKGVTGNATIARPEASGELGWRAQLWFRDSDFTTTAVTVAPGRGSVTPFTDVYATPALGWGANTALRGTLTWLDWEVGADTRFNEGESRELFSYTLGAFHASRFSGGRGFVGGLYAEGASRIDGVLITAGMRLDEWKDSGGHVLERLLSNGAITLNDKFESRSDLVPTARGGIRKDIDDGLYIRAAGYEGFRQPSVNELYRPTRVGNIVTEADPALEPERLFGAEIGLGGNTGPLTWDVTGFWNRLTGAISNVTLAAGPGIFPGVGFLPVGGLLLQRQNVGYVQAFGSEGEAQWRLDNVISLRAAYSVTDARVNGSAQRPRLTGKRPAQTSLLSVAGGFVAFPVPEVAVEADAIYHSKSYSDDQNTLLLPGATTFNAKITWHFVPQASFYLAIDNIGNARVAVMEGGDHVYSYDQPRALRGGLTVTLDP